MGIGFLASYFGSHHAMADVHFFFDIFFIQGFSEAGPAAS
jgi:hypothetical protein